MKQLDDPFEIVDAFVPKRTCDLSTSVPSQSATNVQRGATVCDSKLLQLRRVAAIKVKNCRFKSRRGFRASLRCLFNFG